MSQDKRGEAVAYWNDSAKELSNMVQPSADFNDQSIAGEPIQNALSGPNRDQHVSQYQFTSGSDQANYPPFDERNLLTQIASCEEQLPASLADKMSSSVTSNLADDLAGTSLYPVTQNDCPNVPIENTATLVPSLPNVIGRCIQTGAQCGMIKQSHPTSQIRPSNQISSQNQLINHVTYCTSASASETLLMPSEHHMPSYMQDGVEITPNIGDPVDSVQVLSSGAPVNSAPVTNESVLVCPRSIAPNVTTAEQFNEAPPDGTTYCNLDVSNSLVYTTPSCSSHRHDSFTPSDRPLQPIQLYTDDYANQPLVYDQDNLEGVTICSACNELFKSKHDFEEHLKSNPCHKEESGETSSGESKNDSSTSESNTSESNTSKSTELDSQAPSGSGTGQNQHECYICGKSGFSTKGNLKRHLKAHSGEKPFKCDHCDSRFTEKKSLKIHVRRHTGEKPYECKTCGKFFSQTGVLQSHMALHLDVRKFKCPKCSKAFRQRSQLNLHIMRHDGIKRLECSTCLAKFLTKGDLERHCRIHTGERPYACTMCNKTFTRQQSLNEHMNRHTGRKPYECKFCDKTFSEMSACYKHAKTHKKGDQPQSSNTETGDDNSSIQPTD